MKRNYLWIVPAGLFLVVASIWFWLGRSAELRESIMREAGPATGKSLESTLFFPTPSVDRQIAIKLEPVARGLRTRPMSCFCRSRRWQSGDAAGGAEIAVVLEQPGTRRVATPGERAAKLWFKVAVDDTFTEKGLLGLAFHPRFPRTGTFLNYTVHEGKQDVSIVAEWHVRIPSRPFTPRPVRSRYLAPRPTLRESRWGLSALWS